MTNKYVFVECQKATGERERNVKVFKIDFFVANNNIDTSEKTLEELEEQGKEARRTILEGYEGSQMYQNSTFFQMKKKKKKPHQIT